MNADQNKYPVFEANQVLTNAHLNQVFDYLDEQNRLTRANLIGIGVACGLDVSHDPATAHVGITRGCGVTSEGYLILVPEDLDLVSYKPYNLPDDVAYTPFTFLLGPPPVAVQYPMWEMFPIGEPDALPLTNAFLANKVVVLFLELKKDGLRNCSPNNCDDRGEEVSIAVRKLLFERSDLDKIIAAANGLENGSSASDINDALSAKLNLVDLRIRRFDVPNTSPATSEDVYAAFFETFQKDGLVADTASALNAAYNAFKPVLEKEFPANPFAGFQTAFGFLDGVPTTTTQVRFVQYYYDFFDDLLKAYDEFRWAGAELLCLCCPPDGLFPRHLMLGEVFPSVNAAIYRHRWLSSPASCCSCEDEMDALLLLFRRLVEMIARFTNNPPMPEKGNNRNSDPQIRITPSKRGDVAVSEKCIPYYYTQNGTPPLYTLWNAQKTRRGRAKQNLSYRADEYATAQFVKTPLRFDLEAYNFFQIEGHLGKNYVDVLQTLTAIKVQNRLPIEIVALRTGVFDANIKIDLSKEECTFNDLNSLYKALREELRCILCKELQYFYGFEFGEKVTAQASILVKEPLLKECAPNFVAQTGTIGALFEQFLTQTPNAAYSDPDVTNLFTLINNAQGNNSKFVAIYAIYHLSFLAKVLPPDLADLDCDELENRYLDLEKMAAALEQYWEEGADQVEGTVNILEWEEIDDHFERIIFACKLDAFKAVCAEYEARILELKKKQFLSFFLQKNPGIEHDAGAPSGGTFIIVYHQDPDPVRPGGGFTLGNLTDFVNVGTGTVNAAGNITKGETTAFTNRQTARIKQTQGALVNKNLSEALINIQRDGKLLANPDIQSLFVELLGFTPGAFTTGGKATPNEALEKIIGDTVSGLENGTVIADFFLPYICCSDCAPVQYVLPQASLALAVTLGCTSQAGSAESLAVATLTPQGGTAPYTMKVDTGNFVPLTGTVNLTPGQHTIIIRDSAGAESAPQVVNVPFALDFTNIEFIENPADGTYQVQFVVVGGVPPYTVQSGNAQINLSVATSTAVKNGESIVIKVSDGVGCAFERTFTHEFAACDLPCEGIARRCAYRFWIPQPSPNAGYKDYKATAKLFSFEGPQGNIDLSNIVSEVIQAENGPLTDNFVGVVTEWINKINQLIADAVGADNWLVLSYQPTFALNGFGALFIESYNCLGFNFIIDATFVKPQITENLTSTYLPNEHTVASTNPASGTQTVNIPVTNCTTVNRCNPSRPGGEGPTARDCRNVDLKSSIKITSAEDKYILEPITDGKAVPIGFRWEIEDGVPSVSTKRRAGTVLDGSKPGLKKVRLTITVEGGCEVVTEATINVPGEGTGGGRTPDQKECEKLVTAAIKSNITGRTLTVSPSIATDEKVERVLWVVEDGIPATSDQGDATFQFEKMGTGEKEVNLFVFTENGCTVKATTKVKIGEQQVDKTPAEERCANSKLDIKRIRPKEQANSVVFEPQIIGDEASAMRWEVEDGIPATSFKRDQAFQFTNNEGTKKVVLTVVSKEGCTATFSIDFKPPKSAVSTGQDPKTLTLDDLDKIKNAMGNTTGGFNFSGVSILSVRSETPTKRGKK